MSVLFLSLISHLLFSFFLSFLRLAHGFCCETCHLLSDIPAGLFDSMAANSASIKGCVVSFNANICIG